jgi:hypothetical protein
MHAVRDTSHTYDRAAWSAETLIHRLELPEEREDTTGPYRIEPSAAEASKPTDDTTIMRGPVPSEGVRGAIARLLARVAPGTDALPRLETLAGSVGFVLRRLVQKPIVWACFVVLFALAVRSLSFEHRVPPAPIRVQAALPVVPASGTLSDVAVQDLECLAIQAVVERRPEEAIRIYEALAAHAPEHVAYARAAEIVARSAE